MANNGRFGLNEAPFADRLTSKFLVETEAHRRAFAHIRHGIAQGEGIVILTGDDGVGKSTVFNRAVQEFTRDDRVFVVLSGATLTAENLESQIMAELGPQRPAARQDLHDVLLEQRDQGKVVIVMIDDAEQLDDASLEKVRKLSLLFQDGEALMMAMLAGQTPMRSVLYRGDMDKIRQRIIASYHVPHLTPEQTMTYVMDRMVAAGASEADGFSDDALAELATASDGIPAQINKLATAALANAAQKGRQVAQGDDVPAPTVAPRSGDAVSVPTSEPAEPADELAADDLIEEVEPAQQIGPSPIQRINGHDSTYPEPVEELDAVYPENVSVEQINDAIERIAEPSDRAPVLVSDQTPKPSVQSVSVASSDKAPVQPVAVPPKPQGSRARGMSPQELMTGRRSPLASAPKPPASDDTSRPLPTAPAKAAESTQKSAPQTSLDRGLTPPRLIELPTKPKALGGVWDDAAPMGQEERDRLDEVTLEPFAQDMDAPVTSREAAVNLFLMETKTALDSLRNCIKELRAETEALDDGRRQKREIIVSKLDAIKARIDDVSRER